MIIHPKTKILKNQSSTSANKKEIKCLLIRTQTLGTPLPSQYNIQSSPWNCHGYIPLRISVRPHWPQVPSVSCPLQVGLFVHHPINSYFLSIVGLCLKIDRTCNNILAVGVITSVYRFSDWSATSVSCRILLSMSSIRVSSVRCRLSRVLRPLMPLGKTLNQHHQLANEISGFIEKIGKSLHGSVLILADECRYLMIARFSKLCKVTEDTQKLLFTKITEICHRLR